MAKNLGREFATMDEDERRRFAQEAEGGTDASPDELDFDNPRDEEAMGRHYADPADEVADPERRDGASAALDDEQHERAVTRRRRGGKDGPDAT